MNVEFKRLVQETIPANRKWRWTFETVVECYERATAIIVEPAHFTFASIELRRKTLAQFPELENLSEFNDGHLESMEAAIRTAFDSGHSTDYGERAYGRLKRDYAVLEREFRDLMESDIRIFGECDKPFIRFGVYALWRFDKERRRRSPIPTYIGKSWRKEGLFHRVGQHIAWWDHPLMVVTFAEVDQPATASRVETSLIRAICAPANWKHWKKYE